VTKLPIPEKVRKQVADLWRGFSLVAKPAPGWTTLWVILLVLQGLLPVASVHLTRLLVDSLVAVMSTEGTWTSFRPTLTLALLLGLTFLLTEILQSAVEWTRANQSELIQDHISSLIHQKSVAVDLSFYDSPDYHDHLYRARQDASTRPLALLESAGSLMQNGITLLGMASVLLPYGVWLPFVLLFSTLPAFYIVLKFNQRYHDWWKQTTPDWRWTQHYDWMLTSLQAAPEIRLFDLGSFFQDSYRQLRKRLRGERLSLIRQQSLARLGAGGAALLISGGAMGWMVFLAVRRLVTLGDLVLFYQAFNRGQTLLRSLLGSLGQIYSNSIFVGNLFDFIDLKPRVLEPSLPVPMPNHLSEGIRFVNVDFRYPGNERLALADFNLTVPAGQIAAVVGENGAGKSTLLKLLCRFYDPDQGQVELDGVNLREFSTNDLRKAISVLFQTPLQYHATVRENIAYGDIRGEVTQSKVEAAVRGAGAQEIVDRLPRGYETLLGKWFPDGAELSGGEWQRLALARAFLREAEIIVLDEPTSAMDSWNEAHWLERFRALAGGRTGIIITHRFTVAMQADVIHVMHNGRIVESGTHEELIGLNGRYAQSWKSQYHTIPGGVGSGSQEIHRPAPALALKEFERKG
jgi:ATP-binding cassette, subfamily B, bacterial